MPKRQPSIRSRLPMASRSASPQSLALLPGISRSGTSIVAGLLIEPFGSRSRAVTRSCWRTPVILAAGLLEVPRLFDPTAHVGTGRVGAGWTAGGDHCLSFGGISHPLLSVQRSSPVRLVLSSRRCDLLHPVLFRYGESMKGLSSSLAIAFFVIAVLYWTGTVQIAGAPSPGRSTSTPCCSRVWEFSA